MALPASNFSTFRDELSCRWFGCSCGSTCHRDCLLSRTWGQYVKIRKVTRATTAVPLYFDLMEVEFDVAPNTRGAFLNFYTAIKHDSNTGFETNRSPMTFIDGSQTIRRKQPSMKSPLTIKLHPRLSTLGLVENGLTGFTRSQAFDPKTASPLLVIQSWRINSCQISQNNMDSVDSDSIN